MQAIRKQLSYANVMATVAVFLALGGSAYAFTLGKNSVKSKNIAKGAVNTSDIHKGAVSKSKLKAGAIPASAIADGSITGAKLAAGSVGARELGNVVVRIASKPLPSPGAPITDAFCRPGEKELGGGFASSVDSPDVVPNASDPESASGASLTDGQSPGGWESIIHNNSGASGGADTYAVCLQ